MTATAAPVLGDVTCSGAALVRPTRRQWGVLRGFVSGSLLGFLTTRRHIPERAFHGHDVLPPMKPSSHTRQDHEPGLTYSPDSSESGLSSDTCGASSCSANLTGAMLPLQGEAPSVRATG